MNEPSKKQNKKKDVISKKLRFEVFKRDCFTCIYCGRRPPDVVLHADHRYPESQGGKTSILNLVTSCLDCNLGKAATPLTDNAFISKHLDDATLLQEKREQLEMISEWYKEITNHHEQLQASINDFFRARVPGFSLNLEPLQKLSRFAEKNEAFDCVLDAIADLASERIKYTPEGTVTKESAEHISGGIEYVAKIKKALKRLPHVKSHSDDARYLFGVLRGTSTKKYEMPDIIRFYEIVNDMMELGNTISYLISVAKESRGFIDWRDTVTSANDAPKIPAKPAAPSLPPRTAARPIDLPGNESLFDDDLLNTTIYQLDTKEAVAALLNAHTAFFEFLEEVGVEDARDWAYRAGPWADQLYASVREDIKYLWPEVSRLPEDERKDKLTGVTDTIFCCFFDNPIGGQRSSHLMDNLLRRAFHADDWHIIEQVYSLNALNTWLAGQSVMCRYQDCKATVMDVSPAYDKSLEYVREMMGAFVECGSQEQTLLQLLETPGFCEEQQEFGLYLFAKDLLGRCLDCLSEPVEPRVLDILLRTVNNPGFTAASLLTPDDEEQDGQGGGPQYLAQKSVGDLYIEMSMRSGLSFTTNQDIRETLCQVKESMAMSPEKLMMLMEAAKGTKFADFVWRLITKCSPCPA